MLVNVTKALRFDVVRILYLFERKKLVKCAIAIDFGVILPFTGVLACNLPVYASQWLSPDITQDLVRSCELGFAAVSISGDCVP